MSKKKVFAILAMISESVGVGMIFGYLVGEGSNNTALWIGGILVFLGAIALGMSISSVKESATANDAAMAPTKQDSKEN